MLGGSSDERRRLVWCHARLASRRLYERNGFAARGEPFDDPGAGMQLLMTLLVSPTLASASPARPLGAPA
jgi:hypothetical protein